MVQQKRGNPRRSAQAAAELNKLATNNPELNDDSESDEDYNPLSNEKNAPSGEKRIDDEECSEESFSSGDEDEENKEEEDSDSESANGDDGVETSDIKNDFIDDDDDDFVDDHIVSDTNKPSTSKDITAHHHQIDRMRHSNSPSSGGGGTPRTPVKNTHSISSSSASASASAAAAIHNSPTPYLNQAETDMCNKEYRIWKKNAPMLYEMMISTILEWPSLSVEWIPEVVRPPNRDYAIHRLVLGTQVSGAHHNYLLIYRAYLPCLESYNHTQTTSAWQARERVTQMNGGGYGIIPNAKCETFIKIPHDGDVNRARAMPQNYFLIATKTSTAKVLLFDFSKHSSEPELVTGPDGCTSAVNGQKPICRPELVLEGHAAEGYGLSWNPLVCGQLLSGSQDGRICMWDVQANLPPGADRHIQPVQRFSGAHAADTTVADVQWHAFHQRLFASVGTDSQLALWDVRTADRPLRTVAAHQGDINTLSMSPFSEYLILTGSQDRTVALWDIRMLSKKLHNFSAHQDEIYQVHWSACHETVFASCGADHRVMVWDLAQINAPQTPEEAAEAPPELIFIHGGHTERVNDLAWNPYDPWMVASVADNNVLHLWKMNDVCQSKFPDYYLDTNTEKRLTGDNEQQHEDTTISQQMEQDIAEDEDGDTATTTVPTTTEDD